MAKFKVGDICYTDNTRVYYYVSRIISPGDLYELVPVYKSNKALDWQERFDYPVDEFDTIANLTAGSQFDKDLEDLLNEE